MGLRKPASHWDASGGDAVVGCDFQRPNSYHALCPALFGPCQPVSDYQSEITPTCCADHTDAYLTNYLWQRFCLFLSKLLHHCDSNCLFQWSYFARGLCLVGVSELFQQVLFPYLLVVLPM
eukprot:2723375-Rhodomonas_salina.1